MTPTSEQASSDRPDMGWLMDRRPLCAEPSCLSRVEPPNTPGVRGPHCPIHATEED